MNTILEVYFNNSMINRIGEISLIGNAKFDGCTKYHRGLNVDSNVYLQYTNTTNINNDYTVSFIINFLDINDMCIFTIGDISYKIINKMINIYNGNNIIDPQVVMLNMFSTYIFSFTYKNNNLIFSLNDSIISNTYMPSFNFNTFRILDDNAYSKLHLDAIKLINNEPEEQILDDTASQWIFNNTELELTNSYKAPVYEMYNASYPMLQSTLYDYSMINIDDENIMIRSMFCYVNKRDRIEIENAPELFLGSDWIINPGVNYDLPYKATMNITTVDDKLSRPLPLIVFKIDNLLNDGDPRIGIEEDNNIIPHPDRIFKINPKLNDGDPFIVTNEYLDISPYPDRIFKINPTINNSDPYLIEFDAIIIRPFPINNFWIEEGVNEGDPLIGMNYIPEGAFKNMSSLLSIHNLNNVEFIGSNSFNKVPLLNEVTLGEECVYNQTTFDKHIIINKE